MCNYSNQKLSHSKVRSKIKETDIYKTMFFTFKKGVMKRNNVRNIAKALDDVQEKGYEYWYATTNFTPMNQTIINQILKR